MSYTIHFSQEAASDMDGLFRSDRRLFRRILAKVESLAERPHEGKPLVGNHKGEFSLRVGSYHIVYQIESPHQSIHVLTIKHRRLAY